MPFVLPIADVVGLVGAVTLGPLPGLPVATVAIGAAALPAELAFDVAILNPLRDIINACPNFECGATGMAFQFNGTGCVEVDGLATVVLTAVVGGVLTAFTVAVPFEFGETDCLVNDQVIDELALDLGAIFAAAPALAVAVGLPVGTPIAGAFLTAITITNIEIHFEFCAICIEDFLNILAASFVEDGRVVVLTNIPPEEITNAAIALTNEALGTSTIYSGFQIQISPATEADIAFDPASASRITIFGAVPAGTYLVCLLINCQVRDVGVVTVVGPGGGLLPAMD